MGRFPRRCVSNRLICVVGLFVCRARSRRSLVCLVFRGRKQRNRAARAWSSKPLGNCPAFGLFHRPYGIPDDRGSAGTSLRRVVLSGSSCLDCIARNTKKETQGGNIRFGRIEVVW